MRVCLKECKDAELVRSSVPIARENDMYENTQPEIENCSDGIAPQPNTAVDGSQKIIVPVVVSMTKYLFAHYRLQMYPIFHRQAALFRGGLSIRRLRMRTKTALPRRKVRRSCRACTSRSLQRAVDPFLRCFPIAPRGRTLRGDSFILYRRFQS